MSEVKKKTKFKNGILYHGDCLEIMPALPAQSIDMVLCDLPYGTTACKWDTIIPFEPLWREYKRLIKPRGAIVLTASQPFSSALVMSASDLFKHAWVWAKGNAGNFLNARRAPLKTTEDVCVFAHGDVLYYPQMTTGRMRDKKSSGLSGTLGNFDVGVTNINNQYYPKNVIDISGAQRIGKLHPTQKPVALFEYLIRTYTQPGATVLDNCAGSGTTGEACDNTGRRFVLIEQEKNYCDIIKKRLAK